jgi:hypothetical protein
VRAGQCRGGDDDGEGGGDGDDIVDHFLPIGGP